MKSIIFGALIMALMVSTVDAAPKKKAAPAPKRYEVEEQVSAAGGHRMAGCGLGSIAIQDGSTWMQVLAAFLNGTGFQTFAITSGTSNCTQDGVVQAAREKEAFIEANAADVRHDMALGQGEYIDSLAALYGCRGEGMSKFGQTMQKHHSDLINTDPMQTLERIDGIVQADPVLKSACAG